MRKLVIALTIIAFLACFLIGLYLAEFVPGAGILKGDAPKEQLSTPSSRFQHNLLVIRVDDLQSQSPQLVSIWGLIIYFPEPKLIFQRIYPLGMVETEPIVESFKLTSNKAPTASFLRIMDEKLNIQWDNYVLLDTQAGDAFSSWASGPTLAQPETLTNPDRLVQVEGEFVRLVCEKFASQNPGASSTFDWSQVVPDHMRTDIPLDFGMLSLNRLRSAAIPIQCQIFSD